LNARLRPVPRRLRPLNGGESGSKITAAVLHLKHGTLVFDKAHFCPAFLCCSKNLIR